MALGIAKGEAAVKALLALESEAMPTCTCCGASHPEIRVL